MATRKSMGRVIWKVHSEMVGTLNRAMWEEGSGERYEPEVKTSGEQMPRAVPKRQQGSPAQ